jgi:hypothetical protein
LSGGRKNRKINQIAESAEKKIRKEFMKFSSRRLHRGCGGRTGQESFSAGRRKLAAPKSVLGKSKPNHNGGKHGTSTGGALTLTGDFSFPKIPLHRSLFKVFSYRI